MLGKASRQTANLIGRVDCTRWIVRRVEDKSTGTWRNRLLQSFRRQFEPGAFVAADKYRLAAGELDEVGIGNPVRRRDDDLITGVENAQKGRKEKDLCARAYDDLIGRNINAVLPQQLVGQRAAECSIAFRCGVLREVALNGGHAGCFDIL